MHVVGHPDLSTPDTTTLRGIRIDSEGNLSLALIGTIRVAGMLPSEARQAVETELSRYVKEPRVDLSIVEYGSRRFYLFGEVQRPGSYTMDRPLTVYQALALGGGYTARASRDEIVLLRSTAGKGELRIVHGEKLDPSGLVAMESEDFLYVRRSGTGRFSDEVLPILSGLSSSLSALGTLVIAYDAQKH